MLRFELFPDRELRVLRFDNVKNAAQLRQHIAEHGLPAALLNPQLVASLFQIHVAANIALFAEASRRLKCKSLHSELVFALSPNKHIAESLKRFGLQPHSSSVIVAMFDPTDDTVKQVSDLIEGDPVEPLELQFSRDLVIKQYKITGEELALGGEEALVDAVVNRISCKHHM